MVINWGSDFQLSQSGVDVLGLKWCLMCKKGCSFLLPSVLTWPALSPPEWCPLITYLLGKPAEFTNLGENRPSQREASVLLSGNTTGTRSPGDWALIALVSETATCVTSLVKNCAQSSFRNHSFSTPWLGCSAKTFLLVGKSKLIEKPFLLALS